MRTRRFALVSSYARFEVTGDRLKTTFRVSQIREFSSEKSQSIGCIFRGSLGRIYSSDRGTYPRGRRAQLERRAKKRVLSFRATKWQRKVYGKDVRNFFSRKGEYGIRGGKVQK